MDLPVSKTHWNASVITSNLSGEDESSAGMYTFIACEITHPRVLPPVHLEDEIGHVTPEVSLEGRFDPEVAVHLCHGGAHREGVQEFADDCRSCGSLSRVKEIGAAENWTSAGRLSLLGSGTGLPVCARLNLGWSKPHRM